MAYSFELLALKHFACKIFHEKKTHFDLESNKHWVSDVYFRFYSNQPTLHFIFSQLHSFSFRSSHRRCFIKKVFLEISQNSQENTCDRVSFFSRGDYFCSLFVLLSTIDHLEKLHQTKGFVKNKFYPCKVVFARYFVTYFVTFNNLLKASSNWSSRDSSNTSVLWINRGFSTKLYFAKYCVNYGKPRFFCHIYYVKNLFSNNV